MADRLRLRRQFPLALLAGASLLCLSAVPVAAQEVVQPLPDPATALLNTALQRLARDPLSVSALVEAGQASLALDDVDAALGFYNRAQAVAPSNGSVLAGLAQVAVRRGEAGIAVQLFDNAEAAGVDLNPLAAARGLAYDLAGENGQAQRLYRQALARNDDPEVRRRLALSYAISGDAAGSEEALLPLLQRQDRAAYRSRAFALAILGRQEEAVTIAETMLPPQLAQRLEAYLRYMPQLTPSQQAAAVNLGRFPAASQIGRGDARMTALGIDEPMTARSGGPDQRLIPGGAPLGQAAPPPQQPPPPPPPPPSLPPPPQAVVVARLEELQPVSAQGELPPIAAVRNEPSARAEAPITVISLALPPAAPPQEPEIDITAAFADFAAADARPPVAAASGAVDITRIEITRERPPPPPAPPPPPPAPPAPPPPPAHPSRHWVQVATGQDTAAFRFDWRRIRREASGLLDSRGPFQARWGQSNRLVTGPFPNAAAANAFVAQLDEKGVESFRFTSSAGEEVRPLQ